jgi:hypothetical protein
MTAIEDKREHFTLIVNLEKKDWKEEKISYEQVVHLAFPNPPPGIVITYTVEYERGPHQNPSGSLTKGHSVYVKDRMVFGVTETGRS